MLAMFVLSLHCHYRIASHQSREGINPSRLCPATPPKQIQHRPSQLNMAHQGRESLAPSGLCLATHQEIPLCLFPTKCIVFTFVADLMDATSQIWHAQTICVGDAVCWCLAHCMRSVTAFAVQMRARVLGAWHAAACACVHSAEWTTEKGQRIQRHCFRGSLLVAGRTWDVSSQ